MNHLTDQQLEDVMQGRACPELAEGTPAGQHLRECAECRARLQEKHALAERLRRAFTPIHATAELADRVRVSLSAAGKPVTESERARPSQCKTQALTVILRAHRRLWSSLAAAAAILILALPVALYVSTTSQARAGQIELMAIHHQNLKSLDDLVASEDPNKLADYLADATGQTPAILCAGSGLTLCGCSVRQFRGRSVGSYVVTTAAGTVSVVVIPDAPKSLGLREAKTTEPLEHALWHAKCDDCHIVSIRIDNLSYYAISEASPEELQNVLRNLMR